VLLVVGVRFPGGSRGRFGTVASILPGTTQLVCRWEQWGEVRTTLLTFCV